jgi:hypothetical protein
MGQLFSLKPTTVKCYNCANQPAAKYKLNIDITGEERINMSTDELLDRVLWVQNLPSEWKKYWHSTGHNLYFQGCDSCVGRDNVAKQHFTHYPNGWTEFVK